VAVMMMPEIWSLLPVPVLISPIDIIRRNIMSIFDTLIEEHNRMRDMMEEVVERGEKGQTFEDLRQLLEVHMRGEEEYLYPETRMGGLVHKTLESIEEHHIAKVIIAELERMNGMEENWQAKFEVLQEVTEHHLDEEEKELFPQARQLITSGKQRELDQQYRELEKEIGIPV
jgi:hemerythrin-like domain-containing protein